MDRRQTARVTAYLPVRIWGVDAHSLPFTQLASTRNISGGGAVLQGIRQSIRPGEIVDVQLGRQSAQFRVVWAGKLGTDREGEIGLESLPLEPCIWDVNLDRCVQIEGNG